MRPSGIFCLKVDRVAVLQNNLQSVDDSHRCAFLKNRMCRKGGVIGVSHRLGFLNLAYMRIPRPSGHPFHEHLATDSTVIRPPVPRASGH